MTPFEHRVAVRYLEVDQQGVVFNMWYLAYADDAMTAFMAACGLPYDALQAEGYDAQVVRAEIDWVGSIRWNDDARVRVDVERLGTTSFTLRFDFCVGDDVLATGRNVYVVVTTESWEKAPIPESLQTAFVRPAPAPRASGSGTR